MSEMGATRARGPDRPFLVGGPHVAHRPSTARSRTRLHGVAPDRRLRRLGQLLVLRRRRRVRHAELRRRPQHARHRRRGLHGSQRLLLQRGLQRPAPVEPSAVHLPRRPGPDHHRRPRPGRGHPDRGERRHQRGRHDLHDHPAVRRAVEHRAGPCGHRGRRGERGRAHLQPGPAVRRHPRLRHPDRGLPGLLRRLREGRPDPRGHRRLHQRQRPSRRGREGRQHRGLPAHAAGVVLRRHAHPAGLLRSTRGGPGLPAGQPGPGPEPGLQRPLPDRELDPHQGDRLHPQPGVGVVLRPDPQGVRRQGGGQRDGQPGLGAAAAPDGQRQRRHGVRDVAAAVAAPGPDRGQGPQPQPRRDGLDQPLHRVQRRLPEQPAAPCRRRRCGRP